MDKLEAIDFCEEMMDFSNQLEYILMDYEMGPEVKPFKLLCDKLNLQAQKLYNELNENDD